MISTIVKTLDHANNVVCDLDPSGKVHIELVVEWNSPDVDFSLRDAYPVFNFTLRGGQSISFSIHNKARLLGFSKGDQAVVFTRLTYYDEPSIVDQVAKLDEESAA